MKKYLILISVFTVLFSFHNNGYASPEYNKAKIDSFHSIKYIYDEADVNIVGMSPIRYIDNENGIHKLYLNFHCSTRGEHMFTQSIIITTNKNTYTIPVDYNNLIVFNSGGFGKDELYRLEIADNDDYLQNMINDICASSDIVLTFIGRSSLTRKLSDKQLQRFRSVIEYREENN